MKFRVPGNLTLAVDASWRGALDECWVNVSLGAWALTLLVCRTNATLTTTRTLSTTTKHQTRQVCKKCAAGASEGPVRTCWRACVAVD